jgi:hypothetical protein
LEFAPDDGGGAQAVDAALRLEVQPGEHRFFAETQAAHSRKQNPRVIVSYLWNFLLLLFLVSHAFFLALYVCLILLCQPKQTSNIKFIFISPIL